MLSKGNTKVIEPRPYLLENPIQHYEWGTRNDEAYLSHLTGIPAENNKPYAELWIGAHPNAPSMIKLDGEMTPLPEILRQSAKAILGKQVTDKFKKKLPYLLKVLSIGEALSIQAHPNKNQANKLHRRDPKNYPDDNHKPEIAIAITTLTALVGFRPMKEIVAMIHQHPSIMDIVGKKAAEAMTKDVSTPEPERLRQFYSALMKNSLRDERMLNIALTEIDQQCQAKAELTEQEVLFLSLREKYGNDVGLFSLFLLNLIHLQPGEAVFLATGIPHAYLKGDIVECMANSDNVVRAGLTPKFKDVATLLEILTFETTPITIFQRAKNSPETRYPVPASEFCLSRYHYSAGAAKAEQTQGKPHILLAIEGDVMLSWGEQSTLACRRGQSLLVPAILESYTIQFTTDALLFKVEIPD
jgi:mannose-6-phosphate isomerase